MTYSCLSEKVKFPTREHRRFLNVHGAAGVRGSEALGFPQHNLRSVVGKKKCFADVVLLETFPSRADEAAFCYEAGSCSKPGTVAVAHVLQPHVKLRQATVNRPTMSEGNVLQPFWTSLRPRAMSSDERVIA